MRTKRRNVFDLILVSCFAVLLLGPPIVVRSPAAPGTGAVAGKVRFVTASGTARREHGGAVVYIRGVPGGEPRPSDRAVVRQRDKRFAPGVTVIGRGGSVAFPNEDRVFHNVFSVSRAKRFDLGLYKSGTSKSVTFRRKGTVDVFCNIHSNMSAKIKVVDTRFYAITDRSGGFVIRGLPPGSYPFAVWQPHGRPHTGTVTIRAGRTTTLSISLAEGDRPRRHLRKDGTPYPHYR